MKTGLGQEANTEKPQIIVKGEDVSQRTRPEQFFGNINVFYVHEISRRGLMMLVEHATFKTIMQRC